MKILYIFLLGACVLLGAIILNLVANFIGLTTWYEFLKNPSKTNTISYIWLFIFYPLGLGLIAYFVIKLLNI